MSLEEAFAPYEAVRKAQVLRATWGHLRAKPNRVKHKATILFTCAGYGGDIVIVSASIEGVSDSPWLFQEMQELAIRRAKPSRVSRFDGVYYVQKNGRGRFVGATRVIL
jgi:hypothetical protein